MNTQISLTTEPEVQCIDCPVRAMALFKRVPEDQLGWTQNYRNYQQKFQPRVHLYHEGETHDYVYTLFKGFVKLYKTLQNGKIQAMRIASPGDFIGFQGDLSAPMHHGAESMTEVVLCAFPRDQVSKMLCDRPEISNELIMKNARMMAVCQEHLLSTGARSAKEGIAFSLVELHHRLKLLQQFVPPEHVPEGVDIPLAQEDLADLVGITPIHVNRTLKVMKEEGLIQCGKKLIQIIDEEGLKQLANFDPGCFDPDALF